MSHAHSHGVFRPVATTAFPSFGSWLAASLHRLGWGPSARAAAKPRDPAREAAEVRALADSVRRTDRGFAADLYAAADRHEAAGV